MMYAPPVPEITVQELKEMQDAGDEPFVLDVREEHEYAVANLGGSLIPLQQLPQRLDELDDQKENLVVVHCRSGGRSAQAVQYLQSMGFSNVHNLKGGILAWSREIDPSVPTY